MTDLTRIILLAEELVKIISSFGEPVLEDKNSNSPKLKQIHESLIETSELLIATSNALEDNAWLGGSVSFAEVNLEKARVNFKSCKSNLWHRDGKKLSQNGI